MPRLTGHLCEITLDLLPLEFAPKEGMVKKKEGREISSIFIFFLSLFIRYKCYNNQMNRFCSLG